ncbi:hypothetical protein HYW74_04055 [Candidatus Pacearchaeota archaeon]|nr:hypothetical protein [Candidatus Pacearchaeota archaeon]
MPKKDKEGYYGIAGFIAAVLVLIIHYFLLSDLPIHTTLHVLIGLFLFFIIVGALSPIIKRIW